MLDRDQTRSLVDSTQLLLWILLGVPCKVSFSDSLKTDESKSNTDGSASNIAPLSLSSLLQESGSSSCVDSVFSLVFTFLSTLSKSFGLRTELSVLPPFRLIETGGADFGVVGCDIVASGEIFNSSAGQSRDRGMVEVIRMLAGNGGSTYCIGLCFGLLNLFCVMEQGDAGLAVLNTSFPLGCAIGI